MNKFFKFICVLVLIAVAGFGIYNSMAIVNACDKVSAIQGEKGEKGDQGIQGIQGEKGEKGDQGVAGKDGVNGKNGTNGKNGSDGADGKDGTIITIGNNGNWFLDGIDSGVRATDASWRSKKMMVIPISDATSIEPAIEQFCTDNPNTIIVDYDLMNWENSSDPRFERTLTIIYVITQ